MGTIREKFKPSSITNFKKKVEEENEILAAGKGGEYLSLDDGKTNKIRFLPPHPGQEDFYVRRKMHWITIENDEGEKVRRTVANSIEHGGTERDIIEEYVKFCKENLDAKNDSEKLNTLTDWKTGLGGTFTWVAYVLKVDGEKRTFGLFEFKKSIRDGINKEALVEDSSDPIEVDPFTDPDEGHPLLIKYNSKPNKKKGEDYYEVSLGKKPLPVTDEELDRLEKSKSLVELYTDIYSVKDFEKALDGLQIFDADNDINFFDNQEWLDIVEEVKAQYSEDEDDKPKKKVAKKPEAKKPAGKKVVDDSEDEEDEPKKKPSKGKAKVEDEDEEEAETEEEVTGDDLDSLDRMELKQIIADEELDVTVRKSMSDDDIREAIRQTRPTTETEESEATEEEEAEAEETDVDPFAEMDRTELKQYIADNELSVTVKKSMSDDDIREAIKEAVAASNEGGGTEEEEAEEEVPAKGKGKAKEEPKKRLTADDIRAKLKKK